jgi:YVTN family beta-propeller protein
MLILSLSISVDSMLNLPKEIIAQGSSAVHSKPRLTNSAFLPFQNPTFGIKLLYPSNWQRQDHKYRVDFSAPCVCRTFVSVGFLPEKRTLNKYVSDKIDLDKENQEFRLITAVPVHFPMNGSNLGYKVIYTYRSGQDYVKAMEFYTIINNIGYSFQYLATIVDYSNNIPIIQKMIVSVGISSPLKTTIERPGLKFGNHLYGVAINAKTNMLYVVNEYSGSVSIMNATTDRTVANVTVGWLPTAIVVNPSINLIYVSSIGSRSVSVIDGSTNRVITDNIPVGNISVSIDADPYDNIVFVGNAGSNTITVINGIENKVMDTIKSESPIVAIDPITKMLYAADSKSGMISAIDYDFIPPHNFTNKLPIRIASGSFPVLAVNPKTHMVYVTNIANDTMSVINGSTNSVIRNIPVACGPSAVAVNPNTGLVYVTGTCSNIMSVINGSTNSVVTNATLGTDAVSVAVNSQRNLIYVTKQQPDKVLVINGSTNKAIVGITFSVNPSNAGNITCVSKLGNKKEINKLNDHYIKYDFGTTVDCQVNPKTGFNSMVSWSGNLDSTPINHTAMRFTASKYGTIVANLQANSPPISLPPEFYYSVILGPTVGSILAWLIPFIVDRHDKKIQTKILKIQISEIDNAYQSTKQNKEQCLDILGKKRFYFTKLLEEGQITASTFHLLNDRISLYVQELKS